MKFALPAWQAILLRHGRRLEILLPAGVVLAAAASASQHGSLALVWFALLAAAIALSTLLRGWQRHRRERIVREAPLPAVLRRKLLAAYPGMSFKDADLVERGLRQFFLACLRSRGAFVAMPSRAVDAMWHEFILHTQAYRAWCDVALGHFLHHTPAEVLGPDANHNDGLRRGWYWACKDEAIDPRNPSRLPLLFALDAKLAIPDGFRYVPDCGAPRRQGQGTDGGASGHCATSFGDSSAAGDGSGFGGSDGGSDGASGDAGGSDGGGGDGGGCGGGGSD